MTTSNSGNFFSSKISKTVGYSILQQHIVERKESEKQLYTKNLIHITKLLYGG